MNKKSPNTWLTAIPSNIRLEIINSTSNLAVSDYQELPE